MSQLEILYFTAKNSNCSFDDLVEIVDTLFTYSSLLSLILKQFTLNVDEHSSSWLIIDHLVDQIGKILDHFSALIHFTLYYEHAAGVWSTPPHNEDKLNQAFRSHLPFPINVSSSSPLETSPASLLIIKGQTLKDRNHRSLPNHRHRPMSSDFSSRHSSNRYRHRSPSNHNRSSHSDHGRKNSSNRKHLHRSNDDEVSYNNTYKTITEITSETYEKYMTHLILTHTQYAGYGTTMFPAGVSF
ncbi:unnamed protein product [Rotaria sp. Silwood1]|nr:unnamed protein product [Rotaria sp. Silwood1]